MVYDMSGMKFGKLTVIRRADDYVSKKGQKARQWHCRCECGKEIIVRGQYLKSGHTKSCGCLSCENLIGKKFGRLTVLKVESVNHFGNKQYLCKCDCGSFNVVDSCNLKRGLVKSCGCSNLKYVPERVKHGCSGTRLYNVWSGMKQRCFNKRNKRYSDYGGRRITICDEWLYFENFEKWATESGYDENAKRGECTLDRIDVNGNYEPNNCRWITAKEQNQNKRVPNGKKVED